MNPALWAALILGIVIFLTGFLKQVSFPVLVKRSLLSGLIIYLLTTLLSFGLKRIETRQHPLKNLPQNKGEERVPGQKRERESEDTEGEFRQRKASQVAEDLISRLSQDPARGAELVRKMALEDQPEK